MFISLGYGNATEAGMAYAANESQLQETGGTAVAGRYGPVDVYGSSAS